MNLYDLIRSGMVRRWHCNPDLAHTGETNGHHQWCVASLILALHPNPSLDLVKAGLWHDVGELRVGDLPAFFKDANPLLALNHAELEYSARSEICTLEDLCPSDEDWLNFCDRLAAYLWMIQTAPRCSYGSDWVLALKRLREQAGDLDCVLVVDDLLSTHLQRPKL